MTSDCPLHLLKYFHFQCFYIVLRLWLCAALKILADMCFGYEMTKGMALALSTHKKTLCRAAAHYL